jgi:hypothetical protein
MKCGHVLLRHLLEATGIPVRVFRKGRLAADGMDPIADPANKISPVSPCLTILADR